MIPYSTCMRFNQTRRHSLQQNDKYSPAEWTLVQHFGRNNNTKVESTIINVTSQDDQTLCFTWAIESSTQDTQQSQAAEAALAAAGFFLDENPLLQSSKERSQSDELDRRSVYLLLALRRRKSLQQSIHPETIPLLDPYYYGISQRYLRYSYKWNFNTFSFDVLTSGHSLSSLLLYFFKEYNFIEIFNLDLINVLRCFHYLEKGYHDTNPYHNSVHAADVTQAMHCFLQEPKIKEHLTPLEAMCSLLAAVSHDLDHPGVNQQFLIATNSHLTTMHNNLSVLESHHWRFALSCFYESHIFDHFSDKQWREIKFLLKHLILATDISRQGEFLQQFKNYIKLGKNFTMNKKEHKYFILQIALKCADLGNPCRPWKISQRWSEQICNEFYRQGDFEKLLGLPVTPMFDRQSTTISKTQTEFFKNVVRPLFELWNLFLDSKLTRQLINNLNFNEYMWKNMERKCSMLKRCHSMIQLSSFIQRETASLRSLMIDSSSSMILPSPLPLLRCTKSCNQLSTISISSSADEDFKTILPKLKLDLQKMFEEVDMRFKNISKKIKKKKCINGCGTPPQEKIPAKTIDKSSSSTIDAEGDDEEDDFISEINCGAILSTPALILPNFCFEKPQSGFYRRGSAPGCIDIQRRNDLNQAKGTALLLLCNSLKQANKPLNPQQQNEKVKRRSSFPNVVKGATLPAKTYYHQRHLYQQQHPSQQMMARLATTVVTKNGKVKINARNGNATANQSGRTSNRTKLFDCLYEGRSSLYDITAGNVSTTAAYQYIFANQNNSQTARRGGYQRRRSVPHDIFIRSLNNYTA